MHVVPIKLFEDNYSYAVYSESGSEFVLIDPADFNGVQNFIRESSVLSSLQLSAVFSTHKHYDHSGDNQLISGLHPDILIVGGEDDNIPGCNQGVKDNDIINLQNGIEVSCIHVPCHTRGHMLYYFKHNSQHIVFTGDTLFIGGCGKFFEGDGRDMFNAFEKIKRLPGDCLVYCGHEYTVSNLEWASKVDVKNQSLAEKLIWARQRIESRLPTVPSTISDELKTNIFMRTYDLKDVLGCPDEISAFSLLRDWKNNKKTLADYNP